jgi:hypothetical protein
MQLRHLMVVVVVVALLAILIHPAVSPAEIFLGRKIPPPVLHLILLFVLFVSQYRKPEVFSFSYWRLTRFILHVAPADFQTALRC